MSEVTEGEILTAPWRGPTCQKVKRAEVPWDKRERWEMERERERKGEFTLSLGQTAEMLTAIGLACAATES